MLTLGIVEMEVVGKTSARFINGPVRSQKDVFVFHRAPQPFGKNVVHASASSVHADLNVAPEKNVCILRARKLYTLIAVVDVGNRNGHGAYQRISAE